MIAQAARAPVRWLAAAGLVALGVTAVVLVAFGPLLFALYNWIPVSPRPTDEAMIEHFHAKRPVFDELVAMIRQDRKLERLATKFSKPEDLATIGIPPERAETYRKLLKEAGVPLGFYNSGRTVMFFYHASGLSIRGSGKGFLYGEAPLYAEVVGGDLNEAAVGRRRLFLIRKIDKSWWLQLDST
jgi:hypothetical protein